MAVAWTKRQKVITGTIAGAALLVGAAVAAINLPVSSNAGALNFSANFENPTDFTTQFDRGYSGENPYDWPAGQQFLSWLGDHDASCAGPTTSRTVAFSGGRSSLNFDQLFYWCAPGSAGTGHLMTAVNTVGYDIAWFSPKGTFTDTTKVCWDINETTMSRRKWTQVVFVNAADAVRYPVGGGTQSFVNPQARGTGGFDLGYVSPEFSDPNGATTGIISSATSGFKTQGGGSVEWWQNGAFTFQNFDHPIPANQDKATRYTQCLEQTSPGTITFTQNMPTGARPPVSFPGTIPADARRIVFEDDNYNPPKDSATETPGGTYDANFLTWHWDNIQVTSGSTTNVPPSTTSTTSTTVGATTTASTTTTTVAATTSASTTVPPATTTTVAPTTTTTLPCPSTFNPEEAAWCLKVNTRLHALDGG